MRIVTEQIFNLLLNILKFMKKMGFMMVTLDTKREIKTMVSHSRPPLGQSLSTADKSIAGSLGIHT